MSYTPPPQEPMRPQEERNWSMLTHIIAGGVHVITADWAGFIAALVMYFVFRDRGPFIRAHTVSALNFQLTLLIGTIIGWITTFLIIGVFILIAIAVVNIVFSIFAAMAAYRGEYYRYPLSISFVRA